MIYNKLKWWQVLNPLIYLVSILPGVNVWQLNQPTGRSASALAAATVAVVLLQHAINLLNDVSDWRLGADKEKFDSWVRFHGGDVRTALVHGWVSFFFGGVLGLASLLATDKFWLLLIAIPMVGLGYLYNSGKRPLSYTHLGEWVTGLCYGPGVIGCHWLLIGQPIDGVAVLAMTAFAALAVSLLLSHQPPQIETDRAVGKYSFAVRYGRRSTFRVAQSLFGVFLATSGIALYIKYPTVLTALVFCMIAAWGLIEVAKPGLGPKRVLISASVLIAAIFAVT